MEDNGKGSWMEFKWFFLIIKGCGYIYHWIPNKYKKKVNDIDERNLKNKRKRLKRKIAKFPNALENLERSVEIEHIRFELIKIQNAKKPHENRIWELERANEKLWNMISNLRIFLQKENDNSEDVLELLKLIVFLKQILYQQKIKYSEAMDIETMNLFEKWNIFELDTTENDEDQEEDDSDDIANTF